MISVEELFENKKYPKWISSHPVFSKLQYIRKAFPDIGLTNFEEKIVIDNVSEISSCANQLLDVITDFLNVRTVKLVTFAKKAKVGKKRRKTLNLLLSIMTTLMDWLRTDKKSFITTTPNGKVNLSLPNDLYYNDVLFMKRGTSLLKIYEKFNSILRENKFLVLKDISQSFQFKNFSSINIPSKEMLVKFSSDQEEGVWDIATMSMRGISSCQTWVNGNSNDAKVVGSMIDPFTGIIYLSSDGTVTNYGSRMIRRCIVRYVIDSNIKKPYILLEKMYPAFEKPSLDTFIKAIKSRVPTIEVYYTVDVGEKANRSGTKLSYSYVPLSDEIKMLSLGSHPYCDSGLLFREDATCGLTKNTQIARLLFKKKIPKLFEKALQSGAFKQTNVKPFGIDAAKLIAQLRRAKIKNKIGLVGDPNAMKFDAETGEIDACVDEVIKETTPLGEEVLALETNKSITDLSNKFTDFVCKLTTDNDPFRYLKNNQKECSSFFTSEFGDTVSTEFADFLIANIIEYIDQKNPIQ